MVKSIYEGDEEVVDLSTRISGRVSCENVVDPILKKTIIKTGDLIDEIPAAAVVKLGVEQLKIRSVLTCESLRGVCAKCYGRNLATGKMVKLGEAVGIIAGAEHRRTGHAVDDAYLPRWRHGQPDVQAADHQGQKTMVRSVSTTCAPCSLWKARSSC